MKAEAARQVIVHADGTDLQKVRELFAKQGKVIEELPLVDSFVAEASPDLLKKAAAMKGVEVTPNAQVVAEGPYSIPMPIELTSRGRKLPEPDKRIDAVKEVLHMDRVWSKGITGKGVTVAVVDTGVYPHPDLGNRLIAFANMVDDDKTKPYDDNGHGSHVSGLIAGSGEKADGMFKGTAPEANIIGVKVLDRRGSGTMADVIRGIQWCVANKDKYNIRVMNLSLGGPAFQKEKDDLVALAIKKAFEAGIVPVIAAGNSGPFIKTIGSPANSSQALTIGAYDDKNTPERDDDTVAFFSSRGPTYREKNLKPDVVSPGVQLVSFRSPGSMIDEENVSHYGDYYVLLSGTSMATPVSAGVVADVIQAAPDLCPGEVMQVIKDSADILVGVGANMQGHGLIDPEKAVDAAQALSAKKKAQAAAQQAAKAAQTASTSQPEKAAVQA